MAIKWYYFAQSNCSNGSLIHPISKLLVCNYSQKCVENCGQLYCAPFPSGYYVTFALLSITCLYESLLYLGGFSDSFLAMISLHSKGIAFTHWSGRVPLARLSLANESKKGPIQGLSFFSWIIILSVLCKRLLNRIHFLSFQRQYKIQTLVNEDLFTISNHSIFDQSYVFI